jgi:pimeloyl-ACP methyl ester carboxylesterase
LRSPQRSFQASALGTLWDDVGALRCPTLIIRGGDSDVLSTEGAAKFQGAVPGSRLAVVPGAGHSVMGDNPTAFVTAVRDFLTTL